MKMWPGEIVARVAKEEGATHMFGILGGHIQWAVDHAYMQGLEVVQVRHEQAAVFAADAFARLTRRPGVCFATAGPGMLNMVTGIHLAHVCRTPIVCLFGGSREGEAHRGSLQEAYAEEVCGSITKWTHRLTDPATAGHFVRKAFKDALTPPYGPVALEFPVDLFNFEPISLADQVSYIDAPWRSVGKSVAVVDDASARKAADLLQAAQRPLIIAGDGLYWSSNAGGLERLVERLPVPFNLRRMARGVSSEKGHLAVASQARTELIRNADLVVLVGLQLSYLEAFGDWRSDARFIQISDTMESILPALPTELVMVGDCGTILDQIACHLPTAGSAARGGDWIETATRAGEAFARRIGEEVEAASQATPLHPRFVSSVVGSLDDGGTIYIADSFTLSAFFLEQFQAIVPGQILDTGTSATFGNGVGMAIGAQMAAPNRRVVVLIGDGGMGLAAGDIETAVRYGLPIVFLVYNNSMLGSGLEEYAYGRDFPVLGPKAKQGFHLTRDVRYDLMYATLGCHGEHVTAPVDLEPALRRAMASGKTSVVNVIGSSDARHRLLDSDNAREMFWHLPVDQVQAPARERHHGHLYRKFHGGRSLAMDD